MDRLNSQAFFVVTDDAYDRMLGKLNIGLPAYTYLGICPHVGTCRCLRNENILSNGHIIRLIDGKEKSVFRLSEFNEVKKF